ncbi:piggyBac transposable element-derived protein 4-like [Vespula squamosa]|uniref:PiggyBac transposable element-derived protein 4-like n=1 Tax=Vespula squamosa TaxID=30214 RepID=A0ABD2BGB1_VESSQ
MTLFSKLYKSANYSLIIYKTKQKVHVLNITDQISRKYDVKSKSYKPGVTAWIQVQRRTFHDIPRIARTRITKHTGNTTNASNNPHVRKACQLKYYKDIKVSKICGEGEKHVYGKYRVKKLVICKRYANQIGTSTI